MARTLTGIVASDKVDKTIVVKVTDRRTHPVYKKQYSRTKRFMAHDENNTAHIGDVVEIVETRPLSARKRFILQRVVAEADVAAKEGVVEL